MTEQEPPAVVGIAPCGCVRAASVANPEHLKDHARFIAGMVRDGLRIETWTCQAVREAKWGCGECEKPRKRKKKASSQIEAAL